MGQTQSDGGEVGQRETARKREREREGERECEVRESIAGRAIHNEVIEASLVLPERYCKHGHVHCKEEDLEREGCIPR